MVSPVKPQSTADSLTIPKKRYYRRFTIQDAEEMADLAAKRITDREGCQILGIKYESWLNWKSRNKNEAQFRDVLDRARGNYVAQRIAGIEDACHGRNGARKDWRADLALMAVVAPERYAQDRQGAPATASQISVSVITALKERVFGASVQVCADQPTQLPPSTPQENMRQIKDSSEIPV